MRKLKLLLVFVPLWSFTFLSPEYFESPIFSKSFAEHTLSSLFQGITLLVLGYTAVLSLNGCSFHTASTVYALAIGAYIFFGAIQQKLQKSIAVIMIVVLLNISLTAALLWASAVSSISVYSLLSFSKKEI